MSNLTIRQMTKTDFPAYYFLRREALRQNPEAFYTRLADFDAQPQEKEQRRFLFSVNQPDRFILGAFQPPGVVGMTGFGRHQSPGYEQFGFIWGVFVVETFRGHGIGQQLMEKGLALAQTLPNMTAVRLGVMGQNKPAIALYRQLGFVEFTPAPDDPMFSSTNDGGLHFIYRISN